MENHVFMKARSKDEYLSFVARLILHVREMTLKNKNGAGGEVNNQVNQVVASGQPGMQDPINALQNMTSTATRNPQMMGINPQGGVHPGNMGGGGNVGGIPASNLLQTLTQQRPGPNQQQQQQMQMQNMQNARGGQMMSGMGGVQMGGNMPPGAMNNPMGGNMNMGMQNNMQNQGQMSGGIQGGQMNQMAGGQMQMVGNPQMGQMGGMNMNPGMNQNQMGQMGGMNVPGMGQMNPIVINQLNANNPGGMPQQSPMVSQIGINPQNIMVQNQMGPGGQMNPNQLMNMQQGMGRKQQEMMMGNPGNTFPGVGVRSVTPNQFLRQSPSPQVPSPAGINQGLQGSQMVPSPALVPSPNPMPNMMGGPPRSNMNVMQPSPSSSINTPGQIAVPSPLNLQEEQMYREKFRQLSKYIDPLKRMIARMGNDDVESSLKHQKMNKLLELLCNPKKRIPLDTLLKCEKALEKMDLQAGGQMTSLKEHQFNNPLLEAVKATLQSPLCNHTLQRTFRPCMESLFGPDIKSLPPNEKRARLSLDEVTPPASTPTIPHILQGEIARLDQKFKVSLDPSAQMGTKTIKLVCCLDDKYLPCVPPVSVSIPGNSFDIIINVFFY